MVVRKITLHYSQSLSVTQIAVFALPAPFALWYWKKNMHNFYFQGDRTSAVGVEDDGHSTTSGSIEVRFRSRCMCALFSLTNVLILWLLSQLLSLILSGKKVSWISKVVFRLHSMCLIWKAQSAILVFVAMGFFCFITLCNTCASYTQA